MLLAVNALFQIKIIKTYLRASMSQERFVNLTMISNIENDTCKELDTKELISTFINLKTRKI